MTTISHKIECQISGRIDKLGRKSYCEAVISGELNMFPERTFKTPQKAESSTTSNQPRG
jgi:hypothetical protein